MPVVEIASHIHTTLHRAIAYVINPAKTDGGRLAEAGWSDGALDPLRLERAMLDDIDATPSGRHGGGQGRGRLAIHIVQSFDPNEHVTAEQVHDMGVLLAEQITGGAYKYVIGTHTDKAHLHNHIIICAASEDTHRKIHLPKNAVDGWRETSDRICREHGLNTLEPAPPTPMRRDADTPDRHGIGRAELYATAKGVGVKERLRTIIDLTAAKTRDWDQLARMLDAQGVTMSMRGKHVTYTWQATGFKIRDDRLGMVYDPATIMARLSRSAVTPISFNQRLVAHVDRDKNVAVVWLPGSKRRLKTTIPLERVVQSGSTWRAYLPSRHEQIILNRDGTHHSRMRPAGLHEWFGSPDEAIGTRVERTGRRPGIEAGATAAQRRYYHVVARKVDQINERARALRTLARYRDEHKDMRQATADLRARIRTEHDALIAAVIALSDAIETGEPDAIVEARDEQQLRETRLDTLTADLAAIEHAAAQLRDDRAEPDHPQRAEPRDGTEQRRRAQRGQTIG